MIQDKMNAVLNTSFAGETQLTETAKYEISFGWIRRAFQCAVELLKDVAVILTMLYFLGAVTICVAILFYTFCR